MSNTEQLAPVEQTAGEKTVSSLLATYEDELGKIRNNVQPKANEKKEKGEDKSHPDVKAQKIMKPLFKEWLQIKYDMTQQFETNQVNALEERCKTLVSYIEKLIKENEKANVTEHCKEFAIWLNAQVKETEADVEKKRKII